MDSSAFLGVTCSLGGRRWVARPYDERVALALVQRHGLSDVVARGLSARGIGLDDAPSFLDPRLRDLLPDPLRFQGMAPAVERLAKAVQEDEPVVAFGDYDVDGGTSSALLLRYARAVGRTWKAYIPDRRREGYGPNIPALERLAREGARVIVCVDCGTLAYEALETAEALGLDVIVLDHHAAEITLPPAVAVVNPNRLDESCEGYGTLAAVGVTFLGVVALNRRLREMGWFGADRPEPDLRCWLDLVALGTVADVVPLRGLNRAFVTQGLKVLAQGANVGLAALARVAGLTTAPDASALGFALGPRINAGGRVGESDLGTRLLTTDDPTEAAELAARLDDLNAERRALESRVLVEAEAQLAEDGRTEGPLVWVAGDGWHPGVIGIVASRLKDKYHRPALVVAWEGDLGVGSGRSIEGVDLGRAVIAARGRGLLTRGGGHPMAAGLALTRDHESAVRTFFNEALAADVATFAGPPAVRLDGLVAVTGVTTHLAQELAALGPFGAGNAEPRIVLADCRITQARIIKDKHVGGFLAQGTARLRFMAFRAMESPLGPALLSSAAMPFHIAGRVRSDVWNGDERVQVLVDDAANALT